MGRFHHVATRLSMVGALALVVGSSLVAGVITQALTSSAFADTAPYETFCANTPAGNIVLNDVVVAGALSPASPTTGQQFNVTGLVVKEQLPATIVQDAAATGLTSLTGTLTTSIEATGATPPSISTGAMPFDIPIPNPVPSSGITLQVPSTPATVGPFTATSDNITVSEAATSNTTDIDGAGIGLISLVCSSYANNILPSGFTNNSPPGLPISPVIATAGQGSPPPAPPTLTGPYELYCPHTPVGDLVLNDVTTTATVSPSSLSAGEQFDVTGYQTHIPLPAGLVSAAAGLGNSSFNGLAASAVDAYGATPSQASTGSMSFDVPIPSTVPSSGLGVDFPSSPTTVGPFTASGGPLTIAQDQSTVVVAALSSKAFKMSCISYPNDTVAASGSTGTAPTGTPIRPVIATATASGSTTTTTTPPTTVAPKSPSGPYELYCPGSPVGDLVLNDTTTTATITPSTLAQSQQFQLTGLQTQFSIPQNVVEQAEGLGLTQITGNMSMFVDTAGAAGGGAFGGGPVTIVSSGPAGSSSTVAPVPFPPFPGPFPSFFDMPFSVTLPNPVPSTGVQFDAVAQGGQQFPFTALGGPISFGIGEVDLNVTEFGDNFGLFCTPFPNNTEPTGLSTTAPAISPIEPVIATGSATIPPPPPIGPGGLGPYELFCPQTPVGNVVLNGVTTTATLSPPDPSPGQQFSVTNYQSQIPLPASIASAAAALGNSSLTGTATATIDAAGATPASIPSGTLSFVTALPPFVPSEGVTLTVPTTPATVGPFTATSNAITIAENADVNLSLVISGAELPLSCTAYPDNSAPSGITVVPPDTSPISPVIVTAGPVTTPPPPTAPGGVTGPYELYCPGTPVGNIVVNDVTTSASIPSGLSPGQSFSASDFQTQLDLPSSIASAAAALGNSAIMGTAVVKVDGTGVTPATVSSGPIDLNAPLPNPIPAQGLTLDLPSTPGTVGPFTASGGAITLTVDPVILLSLTVSGSTLDLTCRPYPNDSAATGIVSRAPSGAPLSPVIATGSTGTGSTGGNPTPTTTPPTTATTEPSSDSAAVTQAFQTVFDPNASIADRVAVIQDGSSIQTAFSDAFSSSLASSLGGVHIDEITFPDGPGCAQAGVASPCASVVYDILGTGGTTLLPQNQGYAVSVNGTWLVSTNTVCALLQLFYEASGQTGSPPGCPAPGTTTPTTTTSTATPVTPTTVSTSDPSPTQGSTGTGPASNNNPATTGPAATPSTTVGVKTGAGNGSSDTRAPATASTADPVVEASSGSLAFTGLGYVAQWLAVVGGALMILGFILLVMVDTPRRLMYRLARLGPTRRRTSP